MILQRKFKHLFERLTRRTLPRSFQGRSLLIVFIPLFVTQLIAFQLFYGTYLKVVSRRLTEAVVAEIALVLDAVNESPDQRGRIFLQAFDRLHLKIHLEPGAHITYQRPKFVLGPMDEDLAGAIHRQFRVASLVDWNATRTGISVKFPVRHGVITVIIPRKRLEVGPIWLFVAWQAGSAIILFVIAGLFVRQQVRVIRRLSKAAEDFGLGRAVGAIRPQGAREIREAALAFNRMQARVSHFVSQRTAVFAGVSHDLRTPLTRMRLSLAMIPETGIIDAETLRPDISEMVTDISEMERLIKNYLSLARGEGEEIPILTDLVALVRDVAQTIQRGGGCVLALNADKPVEARVRPDAMRRVIMNLAENARKHGGRMSFTIQKKGRNVEILVDDDGPGIAPERRKEVFRAFTSFSNDAGGTGLGLTIVNEIMAAHGGEVILDESPSGGLRVILKLPR